MTPINPEADRAFMREAIKLAKKGYPAPNPHVGCVLVKGGNIVGRGYHAYAGGPHAEVVALRDAGPQANGATAYVTLEPCNHFGRTGPCSQALLSAGVSRVVIAVPDPNPRATGGAEALRQAGVDLTFDVERAGAEEAAHQFLFAFQHGRPVVVAKAAMSLDGRVALPSGESKWITSPEARRAGHRLRAELGGVLVGRRTVELDNPELTARIPGVRNQPVRIVLDARSTLPRDLKVFNSAAPYLHLTGEIGSPAQIMRRIFEAGVTGVLIEGGAQTITSFLKADLVDRLEIIVAPKLLGDGPSWVSCLNLGLLSEAPSFRFTGQRRVGPDLWLTLARG